MQHESQIAEVANIIKYLAEKRLSEDFKSNLGPIVSVRYEADFQDILESANKIIKLNSGK